MSNALRLGSLAGAVSAVLIASGCGGPGGARRAQPIDTIRAYFTAVGRPGAPHLTDACALLTPTARARAFGSRAISGCASHFSESLHRMTPPLAASQPPLRVIAATSNRAVVANLGARAEVRFLLKRLNGRWYIDGASVRP